MARFPAVAVSTRQGLVLFSGTEWKTNLFTGIEVYNGTQRVGQAIGWNWVCLVHNEEAFHNLQDDMARQHIPAEADVPDTLVPEG